MPAMSAVAVIAFGTISVLQELISLFHVLSFTNVLHDIYRGYSPPKVCEKQLGSCALPNPPHFSSTLPVELIKSYVDTDIFVCKN